MEEFIVDCSDNINNSKDVYKWLIKTRQYTEPYLYNKSNIVVCNKTDGDSNFESIYNAQLIYPNYIVYTFKEFKNKYLEKKRRNDKRKRNERIDVGYFRKDIF